MFRAWIICISASFHSMLEQRLRALPAQLYTLTLVVLTFPVRSCAPAHAGL